MLSLTLSSRKWLIELTESSLFDNVPDIEFKVEINKSDKIDITLKENVISSMMRMILSSKENMIIYRVKACLSP